MEDKELEEALAASIDESFNKSELDDIMNEIENLEKEFSEESSSEASDGLALKEAKNNNLQDAIDQEVESMAQVETVSEETPAEEMTSEPEEVEASREQPKEFSQDLIDQAFSKSSPQVSEDIEPSHTVTEADMTEETFMESPSASHEEDDSEEEEVAFTAEELADVTSGLDEDSHDDNVVSLGSHQGTEIQGGSQVDFQASGSMDLSVNLNIAGQNAHLKVENGALVVHLNGVSLEISEDTGCSVKMAGGVNFHIPLNATESVKKAS